MRIIVDDIDAPINEATLDAVARYFREPIPGSDSKWIVQQRPDGSFMVSSVAGMPAADQEKPRDAHMRRMGYAPIPRTLWDRIRGRQRWRYMPNAAILASKHGVKVEPGQVLFYNPDMDVETQKSDPLTFAGIPVVLDPTLGSAELRFTYPSRHPLNQGYVGHYFGVSESDEP